MNLQRAGQRPRPVLAVMSIVVSLAALAIALQVHYIKVFKPFELLIRVDPRVRLQYKGNLGLYLHVDFINSSPKYGLVTRAAVVLYNKTQREEKYLLPLHTFRILDQYGVYKYSLEELPISLQPWEGKTKVMNFLYGVKADTFSLTSGIYMCELHIWTDDGARTPCVKRCFQVEITSEIVALYEESIRKNSTALIDSYLLGYIPLHPRRLSTHDYRLLHSPSNSPPRSPTNHP